MSVEREIEDLARRVAREEIERTLDTRPADDGPPFLTVAQYAELHHTTPAAVRARIRRGSLEAIRPPGGREYLIPTA